MYTPIQVAATIALDGDQTCVDEIRATYDKRMHILLEAFENAGWKLQNQEQVCLFGQNSLKAKDI